MANVLKSVVAPKQQRVDRCHRCGGLMISQKVFEIRSIDWHCVSCGERIDPVILTHRQVPRLTDLPREEAEKLFVGYRKRRLN